MTTNPTQPGDANVSRDDLTKPTEIYGASDDLIEIEGGLSGEHGCYNTSEESPVAMFLSDGTVLAIHYGDGGVWKIDVREKGALFDSLKIETDSDAARHSDTAVFKPGLKWAYAVKASDDFGRVK